MTRADKAGLTVSLLALLTLYGYLWTGIGPANQVTVTAAGETRVFSLGHDQRIAVSGSRGESIIEIEQGRARFVTSPCSGKVCVHTGWLARAGDTAACVPNGVIVSLTGHGKQYDSINF